jgi:hypothetical protein
MTSAKAGALADVTAQTTDDFDSDTSHARVPAF